MSQAERQLLGEAAQLDAAFRQKGFRTQADIAAYAQQSPQHAQEIRMLITEFNARTQRLGEINRIRQADAITQQAAQGFETWKASQDAVAEREIPEPKAGGEAAKALRAAASQIVAEAGINLRDPAIARAIFFIEGQRVLADAARRRITQARAKEATRAPVPPVMRPGVARPAGSARMEGAADRVTEKGALKSATGNKALKLATQLMRAQRAARGD
jgi:hypothetical protein